MASEGAEASAVPGAPLGASLAEEEILLAPTWQMDVRIREDDVPDG